MRKKNLALLFGIGLIITFASTQVHSADEEWNYGIKTPNQALREVFEPVRNSFYRAIEFVKNIVVKIYEIIKIIFWWLFDLVRPAFTFIDGWFEKITGLTIGETFGKIGGFFVYLVDAIANALKKVFSIISVRK
ncbi:MAG: hypothetical protein G01um101420_353 [Parcubacteria group bacterium Gr01-1014_20]|nr:MAG: hypothetical protein G01um101420_353 [Parcubacteria group bacterium Gr01-1014_20]